MNLRYRVQQWLSVEGSYSEGVALLEFGGASALARRHGPVLRQNFIGPKQKQVLRSDLVRLLAQLPEDPEPAPAPAPIIEQRPKKIPDTPRIMAIRRNAIGKHKERSDLKTRLLVRSLDEPEKYTDEERYEIAVQIMTENVPALDNMYDQLRRFEEEGIEPADDAEMIRAQTVKEMKEVLSLRPRISRLKKAVREGSETAADEIATLEDRLAELEALLGL